MEKSNSPFYHQKMEKSIHNFTIVKWKRAIHHFTTSKWKRAFHHFTIAKWKNHFTISDPPPLIRPTEFPEKNEKGNVPDDPEPGP